MVAPTRAPSKRTAFYSKNAVSIPVKKEKPAEETREVRTLHPSRFFIFSKFTLFVCFFSLFSARNLRVLNFLSMISC